MTENLKTLKGIIRTSDSLVVTVNPNKRKISILYKDGTLIIKYSFVCENSDQLQISYNRSPQNWIDVLRQVINSSLQISKSINK